MNTSKKSGRLIVRNLAFSVEEVNVRKFFSKGPVLKPLASKIKEVVLPRNADNKKRGF